jgi:hypothetical protein
MLGTFASPIVSIIMTSWITAKHGSRQDARGERVQRSMKMNLTAVLDKWYSMFSLCKEHNMRRIASKHAEVLHAYSLRSFVERPFVGMT